MSLDGRFVEQARRDLTALLAAHPELEEDGVLRLDMVEGSTNAMELLDELIKAEREAKAFAEGLDFELERIRKRQIRFEYRQIAIRKYMMQLLEAAGLKRAERPAATVSIATGRSKVIVTDESLLPDQYVRIKREPDKEALRRSLMLLEEAIPGAILSNVEPVLRIS